MNQAAEENQTLQAPPEMALADAWSLYKQ